MKIHCQMLINAFSKKGTEPLLGSYNLLEEITNTYTSEKPIQIS